MRPVLKNFEVSKDVTVSWEWKDEAQGLITWKFKNNNSMERSVILYRDGYYFGNAFWCIYENNSEFNTSFIVKPEALKTGEQAPLFVAKMKDRYLVALLFTIAGNGEYEMEEGGYVDGIVPDNIKVYDVISGAPNKMLIGYDEEQVIEWDEQTNTGYKGYTPNPKVFETYVGETNAPFTELYNDTIKVASVSSCDKYADIMLKNLDEGNIIEAIMNFYTYILCKEKEYIH